MCGGIFAGKVYLERVLDQYNVLGTMPTLVMHVFPRIMPHGHANVAMAPTIFKLDVP
jgi:hypothetical protein